MTSVVLVDDHPVFRRGLRALLEELDVEVLGEAGDGQEGLDLALRARPDVVLMDIQMPELDGVEATRRLLAQWAGAKVLVLTMVADDSAVFAAIQAGALGYLLKGSGLEEIDRAVSAVAAGQAVYGAEVASRLRAFFTAGGGAAQPFPELTEREREVLALMADGLNNTEISRRLFLSDKTVRNRVSTIFAKLGVRDRPTAIVRAREAGLGSR
ncbi:response regulator transcription factor [uncultured Nocardioides sp.]|uniref:Two-component transcriptional response regulator, LuxR family n=1 Tax=uncultured Nocardioides sp. TaxID=198441 RepID=A0A6J4N993_9ACTN|nr:response regulator transcription factor [uncultured Nocardioides sp.]CAA9376555.1 MAG: Two-component transcriptional response regulator, LuxR family [uncultured Nocardioides sp.]